jgi:hypothetical protein
VPLYVSDMNQDVVGYPYGSESGLYVGSNVTPAAPVLQLGASTPFSAARGLNKSGLATQGTRFYIKLTNADTLAISLPVKLNFGSQTYVRSFGGWAVMIGSDSQGAFTPVTGDVKSRAVIPNTGSTATAIYEVMTADLKRRRTPHDSGFCLPTCGPSGQ